MTTLSKVTAGFAAIVLLSPLAAIAQTTQADAQAAKDAAEAKKQTCRAADDKASLEVQAADAAIEALAQDIDYYNTEYQDFDYPVAWPTFHEVLQALINACWGMTEEPAANGNPYQSENAGFYMWQGTLMWNSGNDAMDDGNWALAKLFFDKAGSDYDQATGVLNYCYELTKALRDDVEEAHLDFAIALNNYLSTGESEEEEEEGDGEGDEGELY